MRRSETFSVGPRPTLHIDVASGSVEVRTLAAAGTMEVDIDVENPDDWDITQLGDSISVRYARTGWRSRAGKVFVQTPPDTSVDVSVASADIALLGTLGDARVRSASGDVRIDSVQRLEVRTASGDVRADRVAGRLIASTASGDVRVDTAGDDVEVGSASGDVRLGRCDGSNIAVKAVSGDIVLGLPAGIRVEPDISSLSGRTSLPSPATTATDTTATEPRRAVRVHLRTVSGNITIDRVAPLPT